MNMYIYIEIHVYMSMVHSKEKCTIGLASDMYAFMVQRT